MLKDPEKEIYYLLEDEKLAFEIDNPDVYHLLKSIDGTKSIKEIIADHQLQIDNVEEIVALMFKEGYIANYTTEDL